MLDFLFTAFYDDGTEYHQTQEDISIKDSNKSAYADIDHDKLIAFALSSDNHIALVDLRDGSFNINGLAYTTYEAPVTNRRLIYFRRVSQIISAGDDTPLDSQVQYHLGWQGNDPTTGENIQRTIAFSKE